MKNQFLSPLNADLIEMLGIDIDGLEHFDSLAPAIALREKLAYDHGYDAGIWDGYKKALTEFGKPVKDSAVTSIDTSWLTDDEEEVADIFGPSSESWREVA
jgi:hypothetical protein